MADKKITDLQLRDDVSDSVNFPTDDGIQSYRVTAVQIKNYVLAVGNIITSMLANGAVTREKIEASQRIPVGAVFPFAGTTTPSGYLSCDGSAVSRSTYAGLFTAIGTSHGQGDGSTTFNVPDYRGRFLRGVDGGVSRDPDRATRTAMSTGGNSGDNVGSVQSDELKAHSHNVVFRRLTDLPGGGSGARDMWTAADTPTNQNVAGKIVSTGGSETRPINANVNYIIKV